MTGSDAKHYHMHYLRSKEDGGGVGCMGDTVSYVGALATVVRQLPERPSIRIVALNYCLYGPDDNWDEGCGTHPNTEYPDDPVLHEVYTNWDKCADCGKEYLDVENSRSHYCTNCLHTHVAHLEHHVAKMALLLKEPAVPPAADEALKYMHDQSSKRWVD